MFSHVLSSLSRLRPLRRAVLPLFARFNPGDIRIRHHYTGQRFLIHSFRHKGYWFHGRRRERETMDFFRRAVRPGDTVLEIGGHVGYVACWLAELVGESGRVLVFEPGQNNLPYIRANLAALPQVELIELAVTYKDGVAEFFEEQLTGQNNSLLSDYARFGQNRRLAFSNENYCRRKVKTARLDTFLHQRSLRPDLVKIDVEGAEQMVLAGAEQLLSLHRPMLLIEVTHRAEDVFSTLTKAGYRLFTPGGRTICSAAELEGNVCALHPVAHRDRLNEWSWTDSDASRAA